MKLSLSPGTVLGLRVCGAAARGLVHVLSRDATVTAVPRCQESGQDHDHDASSSCGRAKASSLHHQKILGTCPSVVAKHQAGLPPGLPWCPPLQRCSSPSLLSRSCRFADAASAPKLRELTEIALSLRSPAACVRLSEAVMTPARTWSRATSKTTIAPGPGTPQATSRAIPAAAIARPRAGT